MKVFLTSAYSYNFLSPSDWLVKNNINEDVIRTNDADQAEVIIFVESHPGGDPYFRKVINHKLYKKYRHKCVLYHDADLSITPIPTLSPSIELWQYDSKHKRSFHYIARISENTVIDQAPVIYNVNHSYLYSFIGSRTNPVRNRILNMSHPANTFIKDTSGLNAWELSENEKNKYQREYLEVMNKSAFILCPRGIGPCSYRLFESMQAGRVPVIISDEWVNIPNIDWDKFSIRISERQIHLITTILKEKMSEAVEMGKLARRYWEDYFSPGVSLFQITTAASELLKHNYSYKDSLNDYFQFFRKPLNIIHFLRYKKSRLIQIFKSF